MRLVIIESPFAGNVEVNLAYLHVCIRDCLDRGESPYASHGLLTRALDDTVPEQRALGIEAGLAWGARADATVVYGDLGISPGMALGIERAARAGRAIEYRTLSGAANVYGRTAALLRTTT